MAKKTAGRMVRFGAYLRADQVEALQRIEQETGVSVAYMIRRGIDRELEARGAKAKGVRHGR